MFKLRDYQENISNDALNILNNYGVVYLAMAVRTGKTFTSLMTADKFGAKNVLFLTKKKAISSIEDDYNLMRPSFKITVINDESMHLIDDVFDLVIHDEHHRFGAYPKPNKSAKLFKEKYGKLPMIFLSGTPTPESHSQIFHQFWCSNYNPFKYNTFYKWAKDFVDVKDRHLGYAVVKDYSKAYNNLIQPIIKPYMITFTQKEAGFETNVVEKILRVKMSDLTYNLAKKISKDKFIIAKDGSEILADTAVKEMQKLHQIFSGTVLFEDKKSRIFDLSKAEFIKDYFEGKKLGIFYKFKAEYEALKQVFGDFLTDDLDDFNETNKHIALQIVAGSEGISLKEADYLVYYNIDFSAKNYWQSRDRLTTMDRKNNDVYWVFSVGGIEEKIYKSVMNKKSFTTNIFKKHYDVPKKNY